MRPFSEAKVGDTIEVGTPSYTEGMIAVERRKVQQVLPEFIVDDKGCRWYRDNGVTGELAEIYKATIIVRVCETDAIPPEE